MNSVPSDLLPYTYHILSDLLPYTFLTFSFYDNNKENQLRKTKKYNFFKLSYIENRVRNKCNQQECKIYITSIERKQT